MKGRLNSSFEKFAALLAELARDFDDDDDEDHADDACFGRECQETRASQNVIS